MCRSGAPGPRPLHRAAGPRGHHPDGPGRACEAERPRPSSSLAPPCLRGADPAADRLEARATPASRGQFAAQI